MQKSIWGNRVFKTLLGLLFLAALGRAQAAVYYIHSDHLDTPRLITDSQNQTVWRNLPLSEPFGASAPEEDPNGTGTPFTFNLRFPGQYFDQETNSHYNTYRDHYFPNLGRYGQSDPIGLEGGINTYGYVGGGPLRWSDPLGLRPLTPKEKTLLSPYIPQVDLNNADVHVGEMPWYAPDWADGITRDNDIYVRDPNRTFCTPRDIAFLGHELVHVGQYREGMTWLSYFWASTDGYRKNPYEISAYELQRKIQTELQSEDCSCGP